MLLLASASVHAAFLSEEAADFALEDDTASSAGMSPAPATRLGCYKDFTSINGVSTRDLTTQLHVGEKVTPTTCNQWALDQKFTYFGVECTRYSYCQY